MPAVEQAARARVLAIPGVQSASFSGILIFSPSDIGAPFTIPGRAAPDGAPLHGALQQRLARDISKRSACGSSPAERSRSATTRSSAPAVTVVNESFARRSSRTAPSARRSLFGRGRRQNTAGRSSASSTTRSTTTCAKTPKPMFFLPYAQMTRSLRVARSADAAAAAAHRGPGARGALERHEGHHDPADHPADRAGGLSRWRPSSCCCGCASSSAVLALLLACVGLYGVIAYSVAQRTTEIGVRVALGATPFSVMRGILRETLVLVVLGIAIGIPAALAAGRCSSRFSTG